MNADAPSSSLIHSFSLFFDSGSTTPSIAPSPKYSISSGDFTAYGNVILVSGAGSRWFCENEG